MENKKTYAEQLRDYFNNTPREVIEEEWNKYSDDELGDVYSPTADEFIKEIDEYQTMREWLMENGQINE
jgi:hypothetical protein